ncbi:porin [Bacteroides sp.]|uniref:OprO/OprP family phosphate-selective porin n=1 Tax=Bacteroides sp. TaxID=29523 RepID=UPI0026064B7E|nr:porin [Bacteroides sp.]
MNYLSKSFLCLLAVFVSMTAAAQENSTDKIQYKLTGRMLMDGGVFLRNENGFGNGTEFSDLRVGAKATYQQWDMKVEIGYVGSKVSIKDAFATYTSGKHIIQVGQFYEPFTLDMLCSTFDLRFNQSPGAVLAMTNSRRLGAAYTYNSQHYYACGGFFTDNDISNLKNVSQGYAIDGRLVYRPVNESGKLLHLGMAGVYRTPDGTLPEEENRNVFIYKSPGVSTIDNRNLIYAEVDNTRYQFKLGAELLIYYHKFFLQSEYIRTQVKRRTGFTDYTGQGVYLQCSWLLLGNEYAYDEALACPARPIGRALELCGRFNIVDMNDRNANITGGAQKDLSLGLNYYINKHVGVKVNYSYVMPGNHIKEISRKNFSLFQARFQFIL